MIVLNFILFLFIACGQVAIYWTIQSNKITSTAKSMSSTQDATIARRLTTVVVSDFLCWFPIGLLGLMTFYNVQVPEEMNVAVAIFILPLNSALNPFLYTLNVFIEKKKKSKEEELLKKLALEIQHEN